MKKGIDVKFNIDDSIRLLRGKFLEISSLGYVETVRNGSTGVGATFENLIGKIEDKLELPDYKGIEIKTKRAYSKSDICLFNASPKGKTECETKRIRDRFGYPDKKDRTLKRFGGKINAKELVKVGLFYRFILKIDRKAKKIILCVYDWNDVCIDDSSYWDFDDLYEKLKCKLSVLTLVKAWTNNINGVEHFKYYKMNIYILKSFDAFIEALENGFIRVSFKIGNHYELERYGDVQAHGVGFVIKEEDLDKIFDIYR